MQLPDEPITHDQFAVLVGISRQAVGALVRRGVLSPGGGAAQWVRQYCAHLEAVAAERNGQGSELMRQRAGLLEARRRGIELQNARLCAEWAPKPELQAAIVDACDAIGTELGRLPAALDAAVPGLPPAARSLIAETMASVQRELKAATEDLRLR